MVPPGPAASWAVRVGATLGLGAALAACSSALLSRSASEFVVAVGQERFVLRTSDAETARLDFPTYCPWSARVVGVRPGP